MGKNIEVMFSGKLKFLSNFYPCEVVMGGDTYKTVEHAYHASKVHNAKLRRIIRNTPTPGKAKRIARQWQLQRRASWRCCWNDMKHTTMEHLLWQKFNHFIYRLRLRDTGGMRLCNTNYWHDNYWGSCKCKKCKNVRGQNHLGKLIMRIRKIAFW